MSRYPYHVGSRIDRWRTFFDKYENKQTDENTIDLRTKKVYREKIERVNGSQDPKLRKTDQEFKRVEEALKTLFGNSTSSTKDNADELLQAVRNTKSDIENKLNKKNKLYKEKGSSSSTDDNDEGEFQYKFNIEESRSEESDEDYSEIENKRRKSSVSAVAAQGGRRKFEVTKASADNAVKKARQTATSHRSFVVNIDESSNVESKKDYPEIENKRRKNNVTSVAVQNGRRKCKVTRGRDEASPDNTVNKAQQLAESHRSFVDRFDGGHKPTGHRRVTRDLDAKSANVMDGTLSFVNNLEDQCNPKFYLPDVSQQTKDKPKVFRRFRLKSKPTLLGA